jgi:hypothetical protein
MRFRCARSNGFPSRIERKRRHPTAFNDHARYITQILQSRLGYNNAVWLGRWVLSLQKNMFNVEDGDIMLFRNAGTHLPV